MFKLEGKIFGWPPTSHFQICNGPPFAWTSMLFQFQWESGCPSDICDLTFPTYIFIFQLISFLGATAISLYSLSIRDLVGWLIIATHFATKQCLFKHSHARQPMGILPLNEQQLRFSRIYFEILLIQVTVSVSWEDMFESAMCGKNYTNILCGL